MKTERELFEEAIVEKCGFNPRTSFELSDVTGEYKSDVTYFAWIMWRASASREGYKLVLVELADEIEDKIWENLSANHTVTNQEGDGFIPVEDIDLGGIYKAMIGASE